MWTRRRFLALAGGLAGGAALGGCTERAVVGVPDRLLVDTAAGPALVRGTAAKPLGTALATPAGTGVWATRAAGADTVLESIAPTTGEATGRALLPGRWIPRVASPDARCSSYSAMSTACARFIDECWVVGITTVV